MQDTLSAQYTDVIFTSIQKIPVIMKYKDTLPQFLYKKRVLVPTP